MPATLNGSAPAVFQTQFKRTIFDKSLSLRVDQTKEAARGAELSIRQRQEEVAYRVTATFLDAEHAARNTAAARLEIASLDRVRQLVDVSVAEGRDLPIESKRAKAKVTSARSIAAQFENAQLKAEIALAQILGFPGEDQVRPALEERPATALSLSQEQAIANAVGANVEIRRLESDIKAKDLERRSYHAERLPKINAFGQYSLFAKYNKYDVYFQEFKRHNFQAGVSIEIPFFVGSAPKAAELQAELDMQKFRRQIENTKSRIAADIRLAYGDLSLAQTVLDAQNELLEVARDTVNVQLAMNREGRGKLVDLEAARAEEQRAWAAYYDAQHSAELARLNVQRFTGTLLASAQ
jgi:outer membrane protein TolC